MPLAHDIGAEAQFDFGEALVRIAGVETKAHLFCARLAYSTRDVVCAYAREDRAAWLDGHVQAFQTWGGVPATGWYDNPSQLGRLREREKDVEEGQGRLKEFIRCQEFTALQSAYGFSGHHCNPAQGHEKPRVERMVPFCRQAGFAGEDFPDLGSARAGMRCWCLEDAGMRIHGTTQRRQLEHFREAELAHLLPLPEGRYEVPIYARPKVARDHHVGVAKALYSVPGGHIGERVEVRADSRLVKISYHGIVLREHVRQAPGGRSTLPEDLPQEKRGYAMRDLEYLKSVATGHGEQIGIYATQLLDSPLPWTRMRQVYRLLGLVKRYGAERVGQACAKTLALEVVDVVRVQRILEQALEQEREEAGVQMALAFSPRFARDPSEFALKKKENHRA
ncbi:MAG: Mu transposase domain-containing protein [Candidatus Dormibacteria bacterium]